MGLFGNSKKKLRQKNDKTVSYDDALRAGSSIGKLITNIWNSQKNPGKAFLLNRRVHHGEIGILLGLSNLLKNPGLLLQGFFLALAKLLHRMTLPTKRSGSASRKKRIKQTWKHLRQNRNETVIKKKITTRWKFGNCRVKFQFRNM